jgi:heat shock protein HslJ
MFAASPQRKPLLGLVLILFIVAGTGLYLYSKSADVEISPLIPQRATMHGEYACLPVRDDAASGDCVPGIKTEDGMYYALDFGLMSQERPALAIAQKFSASGVVTPIETLSTDYWQQYVVEGIFSVTDSVALATENQSEQPALQNTEWMWERTESVQKPVLEAQNDDFVIVFRDDKTFSSSTDCNMLSGTYAVEGVGLSFGAIAMTKMFCADSMDNAYASDLALTSSYSIEGDALRLHLNGGNGVMHFRKK